MRQHEKYNRRDALKLTAGTALSGMTAGSAWAQSPLPQMKLLIPVPPGAALDSMARRLAEGYKGSYAQTIISENKLGAAGQIAAATLKSSPADGSTALVMYSAVSTVFPLTYKKLQYNPDTDLVPVCSAWDFDMGFVVGPMVPASVTNLKDYFAWCRANPDKALFGSPASGTSVHFLFAMAAKAADVEVRHVPYRGVSAAVTEVMGGQISAASVVLGDALPFVNSGRCRLLATTGSKRSRYAPNVATYAEQGLKDYSLPDWVGLFLPGGTPASVVQRLSAATKAVLADRAAALQAEDSALNIHWLGPEETASRIQVDRQRWATVVKALNFNALD